MPKIEEKEVDLGFFEEMVENYQKNEFLSVFKEQHLKVDEYVYNRDLNQSCVILEGSGERLKVILEHDTKKWRLNGVVMAGCLTGKSAGAIAKDLIFEISKVKPEFVKKKSV